MNQPVDGAPGANDRRHEREKDPEREAEEDAADLSQDEEIDVEERRAPPARIIHEAIRRQGIEELERPVGSLIWSGIAAGVAMCISLLAEAVLAMHLPDTPTGEVFVAFGYTIGFLIVIMGRMQLFTESTVTAILPLATKPSMNSLWRTLRLWVIVFLANMVGTFAFAWFVAGGGFGSPELTAEITKVSTVVLGHTPMQVLLGGIPSGFLIATIVWLMPSASGQRIWIIILITWLIALGGFAHVVVGSAEAWVLMLGGMVTPGWAVFSFVLPALVGNIVGGTALFAVLAHAQVVQEIEE